MLNRKKMKNKKFVFGATVTRNFNSIFSSAILGEFFFRRYIKKGTSECFHCFYFNENISVILSPRCEVKKYEAEDIKDQNMQLP